MDNKAPENKQDRRKTQSGQEKGKGRENAETEENEQGAQKDSLLANEQIENRVEQKIRQKKLTEYPAIKASMAPQKTGN